MARKKEKVPNWNAFVPVSDEQAANATTDNKHPALIVDVPDELYHKHESISKTQLNAFMDSPVMYFHQYVERSIPFKAASKQMNLGTIVHAALLEGKDLDELVAVIPSGCYTNGDSPRLNTRGAAWRDFYMGCNLKGLIPVKSDELDAIGECLNAVIKTPLYDCIQQTTERERAIYWNDVATGLDCRCKPDFFIELPNEVICYDLKVSPMISPGAFRQQVKRFRYWLQDAHYSEGLRALYGKTVTFRFWVVEPTPPYRVECYWLDNAISRDTGLAKRASAMMRLKECFETGTWDDGWGGTIVLNEWDFGEMEKETELNWGDE